MNRDPASQITHDAANPRFNYYGRWRLGRAAISINSGSLVEFENVYSAYLTTVRTTYPSAGIFAICPHHKTNYATAIGNAVAALNDKNIRFMDYSSGVITSDETCDGCHLNPGGAVALAVRLGKDIGPVAGQSILL
ncbi:MAG: hypothetical protein HY360_00185 [Verrucomicrobia bacterium]|nr:hypothetical protein [Verrucomicrobiota bacterium]